MRFRPAILIGLLCASSLPAQSSTDEVEKLRAEVARLREENARLGQALREISAGAAEAEKFEGTWVIETACLEGKDVVSDRGGEIDFLGNRVIARMPGRKEPIRLRFGISPSAGQLDFGPILRSPEENYLPTGTSFDRVIGRYEWAGKELRISLQSAYTIPKDVSDKGQVLWILKRKKA